MRLEFRQTTIRTGVRHEDDADLVYQIENWHLLTEDEAKAYRRVAATRSDERTQELDSALFAFQRRAELKREELSALQHDAAANAAAHASRYHAAGAPGALRLTVESGFLAVALAGEVVLADFTIAPLFGFRSDSVEAGLVSLGLVAATGATERMVEPMLDWLCEVASRQSRLADAARIALGFLIVTGLVANVYLLFSLADARAEAARVLGLLAQGRDAEINQAVTNLAVTVLSVVVVLNATVLMGVVCRSARATQDRIMAWWFRGRSRAHTSARTRLQVEADQAGHQRGTLETRARAISEQAVAVIDLAIARNRGKHAKPPRPTDAVDRALDPVRLLDALAQGGGTVTIQ